MGDDNVRAVIKSELPKRAGIGFIAPLSGAEAGGWSDNVIYARASYSAEARTIVRRFRSNGMTHFAILQSAGEYGKAVRTAVETDLRSDGIAMTDARILVEGQALDADVAALLKAGPQVVIDFAESTNRGSHFVEVTFLRNNGNLLH